MIGSWGLTETSSEQKGTEPGMAYFADTGPFGRTCGECRFKGYRRTAVASTFNERTQEYFHKQYSHGGCKKFLELSGHHGPPIHKSLHACKFFEAKAEE